MRSELIIKTRSLAGSSDLTLLAPIKPGLVPSLESVTYKTRVKRLLATLNAGRASSHEYALLRPFSDAVERVGKIHSVRVAVLEPEDKVLLAATFDGAWESYIRVLWQKVGTLLDVIFCNTVDYVSAHDHSYEEWVAWAQRVQIETAFFYGSPGLTVDDVKYLREEESLHCKGPGNKGTDLIAVRNAVQSAETLAWKDVMSPGASPTFPPPSIIETIRQGLQALAVLYRLADLYVPTGEDGKYLRRAARDLLLEFVQLAEAKPALMEPARKRFAKQLDWLLPKEPVRITPPLPTTTPVYDRTDVQGGIVRAYEGISHGRLLLLAFDEPDAAAAFLGRLIPQVTTDGQALSPGDLVTNVAVTNEGLRAFGLSETQLAWFPQAFREGMETRASVLGDLRMNHPRRWRLPIRYGPQAAGAEPARVELSSVHLMVQLRAGPAAGDAGQSTAPEQRLNARVRELLDGLDGVRLLSVQEMIRYLNRDGNVMEHFGFADGKAQPSIDPPESGAIYPNQVQLGELLLGYANEADAAPAPEYAGDSAAASERLGLLRNGSFLVIRKLKQDVKALCDAVGAASTATGLGKETILAKMMGRTRDGDPLAAPGSGNDFNYEGDKDGRKCPFQAHIRRANPRRATPLFHEPPGARTPRIMRRGMSYGPRYNDMDEGDPVNREERGLMFMAYIASISEQFEVVQRWISGGNSTGVSSGQSDPFFGVAENGHRRYMRFEHDDSEPGEHVFSIALDGSDAPLQDPKPFVRLEWGAYLFTPSIHALWKLKQAAERADFQSVPPWSAQAGQQLIERLQSLERFRGPGEAAAEWKSILEDAVAREKFISASIWAAIRKFHDGVLRTPYGVLVADRDRVMKVFTDKERNYTVSGYHERMQRSIGEIFLGLDRESKGGSYDQQSAATIQAIQKISEEEAFNRARTLTAFVLQKFIAGSMTPPNPADPKRWELNLDVKEVSDEVLASLCEEWFGISQANGRLQRGGSRWDWKPGEAPLYPGNFTAPSRFIFQPIPGKTVENFGCVLGRTMTEAVRAFVNDHRVAGTRPTGPEGRPAPVGEAVFGSFDDPARDDEVARTLVGALMGFLPTVDGNLRLSLNEWLLDGSFWSLRAAVAMPVPLTQDLDGPYAKARKLLRPPLIRAMQLRPSPELVWRTVKHPHMIGKVPVEQNDKVVMSIVSATQQCLERSDPDIYPVFGGDRRAQPRPTHACPGYEAGMGVILGVLSALLEVNVSMRPSPVPLAFTFEGPMPENRPINPPQPE